MLRLCIRNSFTPTSSILKQFTVQEVAKNCRFVGAANHNLSRYFATKNDEANRYEQVYYGVLTPQIRAVKVFSLSSSIAGLIAQPIIVREASSIGSTGLIVAMCTVVGFFTFVTPVLLHIITRKYVTEITYNPDNKMYKATTYNFFLRKKQIEFRTDDVEVPDIPGMFTTMIAKGVPLFIEARHFNDPMHYAKIMGYDKPMDFKLGDQDPDETDSKVK